MNLTKNSSCIAWTSAFALALLALAMLPHTARAQSSDICYLVADNITTTTTGDDDLLTKFDRSAGTETAIGTATGTRKIEATAYWPAGSGTLYAADANRLGTLDLTDGTYSNIGSFGSGKGTASASNITFSDVDALHFDPHTGVLYGVQRLTSSNDDLLFQINPSTGQRVAGAFGDFDGNGQPDDYVVVAAKAVTGLHDIDDLAIDPADGQMYGVNNGGGSDRLVKIDKLTGAVTEVDVFGVNDMEGLSFYNDGSLFGTTGTSGGTNANRLFDISKTSGAATNGRQLGSLGSLGGADYESASCLTAPLNNATGRVFFDADEDGTRDGSETGASGITVRLYRDQNGNGVLDSGEPLLATTTTDGNGDYSFDFAAGGDLLVNIAPADLPSNSAFTTNDTEAASFSSFGQTDSGNDIGYASDTDGDGLADVTEDANGNGNPADDDTDGDGRADFQDLDSDNDGLRDAVEAGANPSSPIDTDQDGTADYRDLDADGDGLFDLNEGNDDNRDGQNDLTGVADANSDGQIDATGTGQFTDTNTNGLDDRYETNPAAEQDTDGDSHADYVDLDSDADGLLDSTEGGSSPSSPDDSDGDGTANYLDFDSDNDGLVDNLEAQAEGSYVAPSGDDVDGDGLNDVYDEDTASANSRTAAASQGLSPVNTDSGTGDTTPDYLDLDADGDTVVDLIEGNDANADGQNDHATNPPTGYDAVADANSDGQIDMSGTGAFIDNNANGLDDRYETARGGTEAAKQNTDAGTGDTARDWRDDDDDGDFILTKDETGDTSPTNGTPDYLEQGTLPVELGALEATADGDAVTLAWRTSSEEGNTGFHIEMRRAGTGTFGALGFVAGAGTTTEGASYHYRTSDLDPGSYLFRLKQVDRDGSVSYSADVEATVELAEAFVLESAYPNPFNPQATIRFAVREAQKVRVALYDVLGRRVAVLYNGVPAAGEMQSVQIDGSRLASGTYLVHLEGRSFSRTQRVTLVK